MLIGHVSAVIVVSDSIAAWYRGTYGLANVLVGEAVAELPLQETQTPGVRLLTSGPSPANPLETLASRRLDQVLALARAQADFQNSPPFTGRQFTNDEVYRAGYTQQELRHGNEFALGIHHYVRMRYDSAREQLTILRKTYPAGASGAQFTGTVEPLPQ